MGAGRSLSHWINWIHCLSSAYRNVHPKQWIVYIVHCKMQSAMMAYTNVQCISDRLPVSVMMRSLLTATRIHIHYISMALPISRWPQILPNLILSLAIKENHPKLYSCLNTWRDLVIWHNEPHCAMLGKQPQNPRKLFHDESIYISQELRLSAIW